MSDGLAQAPFAGNMVEGSSTKERVHCRWCGDDKVIRVHRKGFLQEKIYPIFGYYPWRCMHCGVQVMLRKRRRAKNTDKKPNCAE